jgi:hypothetical protein
MKLTNGQVVGYRFNSTEQYRKGIVRGIAGAGAALLGRTIIIEDDDNYPTNDYPFTCFPVFENNILAKGE